MQYLLNAVFIWWRVKYNSQEEVEAHGAAEGGGRRHTTKGRWRRRGVGSGGEVLQSVEIKEEGWQGGGEEGGGEDGGEGGDIGEKAETLRRRKRRGYEGGGGGDDVEEEEMLDVWQRKEGKKGEKDPWLKILG